MKKLYETINANNWRKGEYGWGTGRYCLGAHAGALSVMSGEPMPIWTALREAVLAVYPERTFGYRSNVAISAFNDHPDTTVEDVIRVCKLADV